ncbi:MAG: replicative DNA helicase [Candidatus Gracilibacteria bacterium]|nr:replicative DNA helicase [Candidatus Gracilibacteria bacterium]
MATLDDLNKVPPQNTEAEQSVLGSILLDSEALIKVADLLHPDDFYHAKHSLIYAAMLELFRKHEPIDVLTISNLLRSEKKLEQVGDSSYLAELVESVPTSTHINRYAEIVKQKSTLRKLIHAGQEISALGFKDLESTRETLEEAEKVVFNISQDFVRDKFVHIKDVLDESYERIAELHDSTDPNKFRGIPTGFYDLDRKLSGLQKSDLIILAARPAMGKTAFALNIAQNMAKDQGKTVGIFSLEMSKDQLVERLFCSLLGVDSWKLRTGKLDDEDFSNIGKVMDELANMNLFIDDAPGASVVEIRTKARRLQMEQGLDLLILDYLQLMSGRNNYGNANRVQEISEISRSLKLLARELKVPIIALSQLSRAVESRNDKRPMLSDLRESGSIEQDADIVLFMYRDDYYNPEGTDRPGITEINISKHRTGPTGKIELGFKKEQLKFVNLERQREDEEYL